MNILSIGNSFSQDAQHFLAQIAAHNGQQVTAVNLYIGGCSLERHFRNLMMDSREYDMEFNGFKTGFKTSIREALLTRAWDVVTLQECSPSSPDYQKYQPYLDLVAAEVRRLCPKAKIWIHETWGYETGSDRILKKFPQYADMAAMYADIRDSYRKAAKAIGAEGIIPAGKAMLALAESGLQAHRDGYHVNKGYARYMLALVWCRTLLGMDISADTFRDFDTTVPVTEEECRAAIAAAVAATE